MEVKVTQINFRSPTTEMRAERDRIRSLLGFANEHGGRWPSMPGILSSAIRDGWTLPELTAHVRAMGEGR